MSRKNSMKVAIITVAGISSRFNVGFEIPQLKAIYFEEDVRNTLFFHLLKKCSFADCIIIVGGYKFDDLKNYIDKNVVTDLKGKIIVVYNEFFQKYSSGYSLFLGLKKSHSFCGLSFYSLIGVLVSYKLSGHKSISSLFLV